MNPKASSAAATGHPAFFWKLVTLSSQFPEVMHHLAQMQNEISVPTPCSVFLLRVPRKARTSALHTNNYATHMKKLSFLDNWWSCVKVCQCGTKSNRQNNRGVKAAMEENTEIILPWQKLVILLSAAEIKSK